MKIDPDVQAVCDRFTVAPNFAALVQSIVIAEGGRQAIIKAVQISEPHVITFQDAVSVVCRSAVHRMTDYIKGSSGEAFVTYFGSFWAPIDAENDPTHLNENWAPNVAKGWGV
jgi:hypothetical protein